MLVKQISVFVENATGRLADITRILAENNIDLKGSTIADTVDFGILRCIVEDPDAAVAILKANGFSASTTELIAVALEDKPGGLHKVLQILADAEIAVNYIYSIIKSDDGAAVIMVKVENTEKAVEVLNAQGVKLVGVDAIK